MGVSTRAAAGARAHRIARSSDDVPTAKFATAVELAEMLVAIALRAQQKALKNCAALLSKSALT